MIDGEFKDKYLQILLNRRQKRVMVDIYKRERKKTHHITTFQEGVCGTKKENGSDEIGNKKKRKNISD